MPPLGRQLVTATSSALTTWRSDSHISRRTAKLVRKPEIRSKSWSIAKFPLLREQSKAHFLYLCAVSADASVLSLETVALNDSEDSCWAVINGNVYDLTDWISSHPGGASRIIGLCGIDGTSQFEGQHGGSAAAESALAGYLLGAIGDPAP